MARLDLHQHALSTAIRAVSATATPSCILDAQGAFLFLNAGWQALPELAGRTAPAVGTRFVDQEPPGEIRDVFAGAIADALAQRGRTPRVVAAERNDADVARLVSTRIEPVVAGAAPIAVVVQRTVVRERPVGEVYTVTDRPDEAYRVAGGDIEQCGCCRRVRDRAERGRWDFVPRLAVRPPETARSLCELCAELHVRR